MQLDGFEVINEIKKTFILVSETKIKKSELKAASKYCQDYGLHFEIFETGSDEVYGRTTEALYNDRVKYRRTIQNSGAGCIVIFSGERRSGIMGCFKALLSNIHTLTDPRLLLQKIIFESNLWYCNPPKVFRSTVPDSQSGNAESQWSYLIRDSSSIIIESEYKIEPRRIICVGISLDQLNIYTKRCLIPDVFEKNKHFLMTQSPDLKMRSKKDKNDGTTNVGTYFDGSDKLLSIMSFILNKCKNLKIKTLVHIGSYPSYNFNEEWDELLFTRYNIKVVRIDPRESSDGAYKVRYDWHSNEIGQGMFSNDEMTLIHDDSYLDDEIHEQIDIKYTHLEGFKGSVLMKSKKEWTTKNLLPDDCEMILTPYVRREFRIWNASGIYNVREQKKLFNKFVFKQNEYTSYDITTQKDLFSNYFHMEFSDVTDIREKDLLIDGTFSMNGLDITKNMKFNRKIETGKWKVILTLPYKETIKSIQYADYISDTDIDVNLINEEMFVIPFTTSSRLSDKNVKYEYSNNNYAQCVMQVTNIWNEEIIWSYSQPFQAKIEQIYDRYKNISYNSFMDRNLNAIAVTNGKLMMAQDGELFSNVKQEILLIETGDVLSMELNEKIQVSGHFLSIFDIWVRFDIPLTIRCWLKLMLYYQKNHKYHEYVLTQQLDIEGDIHKIGKPFHNDKDILLSINVILHKWKDVSFKEHSVKYGSIKDNVTKIKKYYLDEKRRKSDK